jgi:uncharacterized protein YjbJ (UPF0337 family)
MNRDELQGKWKQYKGKIKEKWGELTDDDLSIIGGQYEQLVGRVQERYGIAREEAEQEVDDYMTSLGPQRAERPKRRKAS